MDFDFTQETITPNASSLAIVGGTGALQLPSGTTAQQPGTAAAGAIRWNTTVPRIEYYNGTVWGPFGSGSVTSVAASGGTTGLSFTGSPITTSGTLTLTGTLAIANGGTGQTTAAAAYNALSPMTTTGDIEYEASAGTAARLAIGTTGQVLTVASGLPSWATVGAASYSVNVGPAGTIAWSLVSGNTYNAVITHNLGTQNVVVQMADISNNQIVNADLVTVNSSTQVTVQVVGNTRTLRVVIIANGASIAAGGSTPSSVIVQNAGVTVSGGPMTTLNVTNYSNAVTGAAGVATLDLRAVTVQVNGTPVAGGPFTTINFAGTTLSGANAGSGVCTVTDSSPPTTVIRALTFFATSLDSPNNADWTINALAPTVADPTNAAINVRQFSNTTEQGVGTLISIPAGATNIIFTYKGRLATAVAGNLQMRVYIRKIADATTPAAVGAWSAANNFTSNAVTANTFVQTYSYTATLASLSLVTGNLYQFELTRNVTGTVAANWLMSELTISFT